MDSFPLEPCRNEAKTVGGQRQSALDWSPPGTAKRVAHERTKPDTARRNDPIWGPLRTASCLEEGLRGAKERQSKEEQRSPVACGTLCSHPSAYALHQASLSWSAQRIMCSSHSNGPLAIKSWCRPPRAFQCLSFERDAREMGHQGPNFFTFYTGTPPYDPRLVAIVRSPPP